MSVDREWTEEEADELQRLLSRGLSWKLIGKLLHRGQEAVHTQAAIMGLRKPGSRPYTACDSRSGSWSELDLDRLAGMVSAGCPWRQIADALGRTRYAVKLKAARLGLLRGEPQPEPTGWPVMLGTPEERDARFRRDVMRAALDAGLFRRAAA